MIRAVLVGWSEADWRVYRQPQWIAEVRRSPAASALPRRHFDVDEDAYAAALEAWSTAAAGAGEAAAVGYLVGLGAVEIAGP